MVLKTCHQIRSDSFCYQHIDSYFPLSFRYFISILLIFTLLISVCTRGHTVTMATELYVSMVFNIRLLTYILLFWAQTRQPETIFVLSASAVCSDHIYNLSLIYPVCLWGTIQSMYSNMLSKLCVFTCILRGLKGTVHVYIIVGVYWCCSV